LGTKEIILIHHTDCGMLTLSSQAMKDHVKKAIPDATKEIDAIDFGAFPELEASVKDDVEFLKSSPLILKDIPITGWIYEVETGKVIYHPLLLNEC
jgi:carbonic anhydrase